MIRHIMLYDRRRLVVGLVGSPSADKPERTCSGPTRAADATFHEK